MTLFKKQKAQSFNQRSAAALQKFEDAKTELETINQDIHHDVGFVDEEIERLKAQKKASLEVEKKNTRAIGVLAQILGE